MKIICSKCEEIREREFKKALRVKRVKFGTNEYAAMEHLSYAIVEGILTRPLENLKNEANDLESNKRTMDILTKIFKYE